MFWMLKRTITLVLLSTHNMFWLRNKKLFFALALLTKGLNIKHHLKQKKHMYIIDPTASI